MADDCDTVGVKTTSDAAAVGDTKPQSSSDSIMKKSIKDFSLAKNGIFYILLLGFGIFLLSLLIAILAVTVSKSRKPVYSSCADIAESSPSSVSGYYFIKSSNGSHVQVYCHVMNIICIYVVGVVMNCLSMQMGPVCGRGRRGWTRVTHQENFNMMTLRTNSCETYSSFVNFGMNYSHICVQLQSSMYYNILFLTGLHYDYSRQCAPFYPEVSIDEPYVHGISITHGSPRQHILSLSNGCENVDDDEYIIPEFVGHDYVFNRCAFQYILIHCYFHTSQATAVLDYITTDDIEVRICNGVDYTNFYFAHYYISKLIIFIQ